MRTRTYMHLGWNQICSRQKIMLASSRRPKEHLMVRPCRLAFSYAEDCRQRSHFMQAYFIAFKDNAKQSRIVWAADVKCNCQNKNHLWTYPTDCGMLRNACSHLAETVSPDSSLQLPSRDVAQPALLRFLNKGPSSCESLQASDS